MAVAPLRGPPAGGPPGSGSRFGAYRLRDRGREAERRIVAYAPLRDTSPLGWSQPEPLRGGLGPVAEALRLILVGALTLIAVAVIVA